MIHAVSEDIATQVEKYGTDKKGPCHIYSGLNLQSFQFHKKFDCESHNPFQFIFMSFSLEERISICVIFCARFLNKNIQIHYTIIKRCLKCMKTLYYVNNLKL